MEDERSPRHLADPPAPPGSRRPAAVASEPRAVSASIDVPRRQTDAPSPRDASLFQELLRGFGEMRERMIAAESKVDFLSNLLPEIWARMASQEATAQTSQRNMAEITQEAKVQAAQASMAAERSHHVAEHLKEMMLADEEARRAVKVSAASAQESAQSAEVLAARLEEQIKALASAHSAMSALRQEVLDTSGRAADEARSFYAETQRVVDDALREARGVTETAAAAARETHQETRRAAEDATQRIDRIVADLAQQMHSLHDRLADDEIRRAENANWAAELEVAIAGHVERASQAADAASEQAALMELREQSAASARENTMKSVDSIMRSARETFVASRDAGDEVISQAKEASSDAATSAELAKMAAEDALTHALGAAEARQNHLHASEEAEKASAAASAASALAVKLLDEQRDMTSAARQVARSVDDARAASVTAANEAGRAEEAARAAAGEAARIANAEADRLQAFERSVSELRDAATEAITAAETTRGLLWQIASDELSREKSLQVLSERYDHELQSLEGAVQSARGAARSAQEAARTARAASDEAVDDAGQAAEAAAQATRVVTRARSVEIEAESPEAESTFQIPSDASGPDFWAKHDLDGDMLLEEEQDEMWVERFRKVWAGRGRRASEERND